MKPISVLLTAVQLSFVFNAQSQQLANPIDHALLNIYSQLYVYPQEKIYVQTDRPYYLTGERMFFRAFLLHASTLKPSTLSRYVYVELISPQDTAVLRTKIRIDESNLFYGSLLLPESLPEGHYRLRSYTRYMENTGEAYFSRVLFILPTRKQQWQMWIQIPHAHNSSLFMTAPIVLRNTYKYLTKHPFPISTFIPKVEI